MNMSEALEWAADYAERNKMFEVPVNRNGYPVDGFKTPGPEEKSSIIIRLAREACDEGGSKGDLNFLRQVFHNLGEARIDSATETSEAKGHLETIYHAVRSHLERRDK